MMEDITTGEDDFLRKLAVSKFGGDAYWMGFSDLPYTHDFKIGDKDIHLKFADVGGVGWINAVAPDWLFGAKIKSPRFPASHFSGFHDDMLVSPAIMSPRWGLTSEDSLEIFRKDIAKAKEERGQNRYSGVRNIVKWMLKTDIKTEIRFNTGGTGFVQLINDNLERRTTVSCMLRKVYGRDTKGEWAMRFILPRSVDMMTNIRFEGDFNQMIADLVFAKLSQ